MSSDVPRDDDGDFRVTWRHCADLRPLAGSSQQMQPRPMPGRTPRSLSEDQGRHECILAFKRRYTPRVAAQMYVHGYRRQSMNEQVATRWEPAKMILYAIEGPAVLCIARDIPKNPNGEVNRPIGSV